ncbi:DUF924 family protein [Halopseudomonas pelagia]|uniref:DUF924 domain-containing protein n=1 Tax=Halopseudomonas pelagia TaxID=553151 RepID=A0AA91U2K1_9GAMM|nr:DUF924 family protein [Halopseudomonas pelagia]PCC99357.1 hypothetical protein CO192_10820 [Halopseudomonas pelagia]QFY55456.1 DUF924 domain-containing protein [Halopseudomonas pelagia]
MIDEINRFWFEEIKPAQWWKVNLGFDRQIAERFAAVHRQGERGELESWRATPEGRLAEILVLDQFSRNIWRDTPRAFASDGMALVLAQEAVRQGADQELPVERRRFVYMPFMHSESLPIHEMAVQLFSAEGLEDNLKFEWKHREILERFGRYPHRNAVLGRPSSLAELAFLKQPGSSF